MRCAAIGIQSVKLETEPATAPSAAALVGAEARARAGSVGEVMAIVEHKCGADAGIPIREPSTVDSHRLHNARHVDRRWHQINRLDGRQAFGELPRIVLNIRPHLCKLAFPGGL